MGVDLRSGAPAAKKDAARRKAFVSAMLRIAMAVGGLTILPAAAPSFADYAPVFIGYAAFGCIMLLMISFEVGGTVRQFSSGVVDLLLITALIQHGGSVQSPLVAFYVIHTMVYSLATSPVVGGVLSIIACLMYASIVALEYFGVLPYAPGTNFVALSEGPAGDRGLLAGVLIVAMLAVSSAVLGFVARLTRNREEKLESLNQRLADMSRKDPLTDLFNRRYMETEIERALAWSRRGRPSVVLMIDLDGFKQVNDTEGHLVGDKLLVELASVLKRCIREVDVAGRHGGDEFVVVLHDTDAMQATVVGARITKAIREFRLAEHPDVSVTASIGLALAGPEDTVESLLQRTDTYAYEAKRSGGDRLRGSGGAPSARPIA